MSAKYYVSRYSGDFWGFLCVCIDEDSHYFIKRDFSINTTLECLSDHEWKKEIEKEIKSKDLIEISNPRFIYSNQDL